MMIKKRERFKRLIGINSPERQHHGGIEHLMLNQITGWVISEVNPFHEVRLLAGSNLIARAEINQPRLDVSAKFKYDGNPGFLLHLPYFLPAIDWNQPTRLMAMSADGSHQAELQLLKDSTHTREHIQRLLQNSAIGTEGHFDGLVQGALQGWAARKNQQHPAQIWLQCEGHEPMPLLCDQPRQGMESLGISSRCGFRMLTSDLPPSWKGRSLSCSFDREGTYPLPQNEPVHMPMETLVEVVNIEQTNNHLNAEPTISSSSEEIKAHWEEVKMLTLILDEIENKLDRRDRELIAAKQVLPTKKKNWIKRLLGLRQGRN